MATKLFYIVFHLYLLNLTVYADEKCVCADDEASPGKISLWDFLSEQDRKEAAGEENPYAVIPGLLPRLPCGNCIESSRKKRRIEEKVLEKIVDNLSRQSKRSINFSKKNCAHGYYKLGSICLEKFIVERRFGRK